MDLSKIDAEQLKELYVDQRKSMSEVGRILGIDRANIKKALVRLGIAVRPKYGSKIDTAELRRMYAVEGLKVPEIAQRLGVDTTSVYRRLRSAGISTSRALRTIPREQLYESYVVQRLSLNDISFNLCISTRIITRELDRHCIPKRQPGDSIRKRISRDLLHKLYVEDQLKENQIAGRLGVSSATVSFEMKRHGITPRVPVTQHSPSVIETRASSGLDKQTIKTEIKRLHVDQGWPEWRIAEKLNVPLSTVVYRVRTDGLRPRRKAE